MLNNVYRLVAPKLIEKVIMDENIEPNTVIVRPTYLSICHADQRYYGGQRDVEILKEKLPMALIHEGVGEVVKDYSGKFQTGDRVVIVPNTPFSTGKSEKFIQENYLPTSKFRSSGYDGLMQEYVFSSNDRLVSIPDEVPSNVAAYVEMVSVVMHSIKRLNRVVNGDDEVFGVWGDGNLGYISAILIRALYPQSQLIIFGKHESKLSMFSFANKTYTIDDIPRNISVSQAIEATGGKGSQGAIDQIINLIKPQGSVALMGVSENPVEINTRMLLSKGITLSGTSRSGLSDFEDTIKLLVENKEVLNQLNILIGIETKVNNIEDIHDFFDRDLVSGWGKSVMKWNI